MLRAFARADTARVSVHDNCCAFVNRLRPYGRSGIAPCIRRGEAGKTTPDAFELRNARVPGNEGWRSWKHLAASLGSAKESKIYYEPA